MNKNIIPAAALIVTLCTAAGLDASAQSSYEPRAIVADGSPFHGVHGIRFDANDELYATSVIGQSIFKVDTETGEIETVIGPPEGMADDIAFAADGTMVWTAIEDGIVYAKAPDGPIRRLVENRRGVNAVSFSPDGERLFLTLVFYGDALYELDLEGRDPPRLIAENMGGLNAFDVAEDGMIYGPLVFGGRVVRIDPDSGEMTTVSDDFKGPGALKLDSMGSAYVHDDDVVKRVDLATGATSVIAELPSGADNLAVDSEGRLFVSLSSANAIAEVNVDTGELRYVVEPTPLNSPTGMAAYTIGGRDALYVGDLFGGVRVLDGEDGTVSDTPVDLFQPAHVSLRGDRLIVANEVFGEVQRLDRQTFEVLAAWEGFDTPSDVLEAPEGALIVAETGTGRVLHVTGPEPGDRRVVAEGLDRPRGLAWADGGDVYVTETRGGRLLRIDVASGETTVLASGLQQPEGVAVAPNGTVVVVEVGARQLQRFDPRGGPGTVIAEDLPIGHSDGPSLYRSVAVTPSAIYINSDIDNTIYRLTPSD